MATLHKKTRNTILATCEDVVLMATCLLGFLVPFGVSKNINLQALLVIFMGLFGWTAVWLRRREHSARLGSWVAILLGLYCAGIVVSLLAHLSWLNAFGTPLVRLGSAALLAIVGSSLALSLIDRAKLRLSLYGSLTGLSLLSIPYTMLHRTHLVRLDGLFHQSDILAVCAATGLLLGIGLWQTRAFNRKLLAIVQASLVVVTLLSKTRAVILLTIVIGLGWAGYYAYRQKRWKPLVLATLLVLIIVSLMAAFNFGRVTSASYARESVSYRYALQRQAVKSLPHEPFLGYGAGSVSQALKCGALHNPALLKTCHEGFYFDSSHNIYLDRVLAFGWVSGVAFIVFVFVVFGRIFRHRDIPPEAYAALLVALYYLTNVTDLEVELLFWVLLLSALPRLKKGSTSRV